MGDTKAKAKGDLATVQDALAAAKEARVVAEEARRKAEAEVEAKVACLEVEWTSLLLEIGATKDKVSFLHSQADKDSPWRRITRRPYRSFLPTATGVVFSNTTYLNINQRFQMVCLTPLTRCRLSLL